MSFTAPLSRGDTTPRLAPLTLVLGGAASGKSEYAEALLASEKQPVYVATAAALDGEMAERIARHRARRGAAWSVVEEQIDLAGVMTSQAKPGRVLLVECMTLWLSNLMAAQRDIDAETVRLLETLGKLPAPAVLVANEVGMGIVPDNALARAFREHAGRLNQRLAALCQRVVLVTAGLPLMLKDIK